jgi:hypothetical protein
MTKRSPFQRALDAANKRLEKAQNERLASSAKLAALADEIPHLQATIQALNQQMNKKTLDTKGMPIVPVGRHEVAIHLSEQAGIPTGDLSKFALPQDLTGMGSVPNVKGPEVAELSEDDLLRDDL